MATPHLYINVGQTIGMATLAVTVLVYVFDYRGFRRDLHEMLRGYRIV